MKKQTVLANPGSIGLSFAGETDQFKIIANLIMMAERIGKGVGNIDECTEETIENSLGRRGLEITAENIAKVKAFFPEGRVWRRDSDQSPTA